MEEFELISNIPAILQYFIPGVCSISIFSYLTSKVLTAKTKAIVSCVISYVLLSIISLLRIKMKFFAKIPNTAICNSGVAIIFGLLLSFIFALIFRAKWFSNVLVRLTRKTPNSDIWKDIIDYESGSNLKLYLTDKDYYILGHLYVLEEKNDERWISVSAFQKRNKETNESLECEQSHLNDDNAILAVRMSDIEYIEVYN